MNPLGWTRRLRRRELRPPSGWLILGLFLILLLLVLNAGLFLTYRQVRGMIEEELGRRLLAIASATAVGISPGEIAALRAEPDGAESRRLQNLLGRVRFETGLGEITLFDPDRRHLLDADGQLPPGYENPVLDLHFGAVTAALAGVAATSDLYRVGSIYLRTAYAPVLGEHGEVVGVIGVEGGTDFFQGLWDLRRQVLLSAAAGMIAVLLLTLFFARLLRTQAVAERTLRETAALAAAGELAAILAHEIRNPLAIISSRAERVRAKIAQGKSAGEVLEWFDAIPREVDRLDAVLTGYLAFARPGDLEAETTQLRGTVEAALSLLAGDFARKGIELARTDQAAGELRVAMAPAALHQVLLNLLLNARDAMPEGGQVRLDAQASGRWLLLRIADNGCGMTGEQRRRAFESFYTTKPQGSGLGLAVVRSMVDLYGGRITLESEPGTGTRITLRLPLAAPEGT